MVSPQLSSFQSAMCSFRESFQVLRHHLHLLAVHFTCALNLQILDISCDNTLCDDYDLENMPFFDETGKQTNTFGRPCVVEHLLTFEHGISVAAGERLCV